ncbi:heavy-metal-associated domain-containing protein [Pedobacter changchengzhani]|uniref:Heavy-metal-associated domain-containing protein n=1 Tax=Pedobacter changchengzhani TaxID=2529274 RepID=A0A4R5MHB4_9SPHI|nr:heavy metal-associated domain-containing protein [Pedobacter changchengzhani]TDG34920.1 heavy-metal-associated domain-containing protein [Pedobacter changchengzhani]
MENKYKITGMSCGGCVSHVQKALSNVQGVSKVEVNLQDKSATIEMTKPIPLAVFKDALGNYGIENL